MASGCLATRQLKGALFLALAALFAVPAYARRPPPNPDIWVDPHKMLNADMSAVNCTTHPDTIYGKHPQIVHDGGIRVELVGAAGSQHATVCPGRTYTIQVGFGGQERSSLITASAGVFYANTPSGRNLHRYLYPDDNAKTMPCPNRLIALESTSVETQITIPCDAEGEIEIRVTSSFMPVTELKQAVARFAVTAECTAAVCSQLEEMTINNPAARARRRVRRMPRPQSRAFLH